MSKKQRLPVIALAGRRNVGKSTILNLLLGKRRAITDDLPGLTRDVIRAEVERNDYHFILMDTPGLDIENPDALEQTILENARKHIGNADLVILLLEAPAPSEIDYEYIDFFRKQQSQIPVIYVINKMDSPEKAEQYLSNFYEAGIANPIPVSAKSRYNIKTLLHRIGELLPETKKKSSGYEQEQEEEEQDKTPQDRSSVTSDPEQTDTRIAIVGKPNAGKSSILNRLASEEISVVSEIPGTTRDTVDTVIGFKGKRIRIVDTAGIRKVSRLKGDTKNVEFYSLGRTKRAIQDSRVVILVLDATVGITDFDKKIAALVVEAARPMVLAINKWDLVPEKQTHSVREFEDKLFFHFPVAKHYPRVFLSALTGQRLTRVLDLAVELEDKIKFRISTGKLNELVDLWNQKLKTGQKGAKIQYAVQADREPPVFIFFAKNKDKIPGSMITFFENRIREAFHLDGIPIRVYIRSKEN